MKVGFWGNFGTHNLGNECTLYAMLASARRHLPGAELVGICCQPQDTSERHRIEALPIATDTALGLRRERNKVPRIKHLAGELEDFGRAIRTMRSIDLLVMTGTGMLTDKHESFFGMPFQMFKWSMAAKLCRRKVAFVSVGAEGLERPTQLFFLSWSLRRAWYRSYRDPRSKERGSRLLGRASNDPVYPDLAFSLPESLTARREKQAAGARTVAVGIYAVESGEAALERYVETVGSFVLKLLEHGYRTRIVIGDAEYDGPVRAQLRSWLDRKRALDRVVDEPVGSFEELMDQLAEADLVVATRFHNVLLSLILGKPVLSVSHMDKNDELMASMGLSSYCMPLEDTGLPALWQRFEELERNSEQIRNLIKDKAKLHRSQLEEQYSVVFGALIAPNTREGVH